MNILRETIYDSINRTPFTLKKTDIARDDVYDIELSRNTDLELVLKLTSHGRDQKEFPGHPAGTIRTSDGVIEFELIGGAHVRADHVVHRGTHTHSSRLDGVRTVDTYKPHQIELTFGDQNDIAYTVEWVGNLSDRMMFPDICSRENCEKLTLTLGRNSNPLKIKSDSEERGFVRALYLNISGLDVYLMHDQNDKDGKAKRGTIIYGSVVPREQRDKIRNCISFAFGLPILLFGETEFRTDWSLARTLSYSVHSIDGGAFKIVPLIPYPINEGIYENIIDPAALSTVVDALLKHYEEIKFNKLLWMYWHALCAPLHSSAVQFGGLIEQLQRTAPRIVRAVRTKLVDDEKWKDFSRPFLASIDTMQLDEATTKILKNKISNMNQVPQGLVLKRMIDNLGLRLSTAEEYAWRHRNISAHGDISDDHLSVILSSKLLRLLFHRFLAGVTYCSDRYFDYYNLGFPIRELGDEIPPRT